MDADGERVFKAAMQVFREYLIDCDADIEGCSSLEEIEHSIEACRELRRRFVALVTDPASCDERGVKPQQSEPVPATEPQEGK